MKRLFLLSLTSLTFAFACGQSGGSTTTSTATTEATSSSASSTSSSSASSSSGTGGMTTSSSSSSSSGTGGSGGSGGSGGAMPNGAHVLIGEVATSPGANEFVEIYNPTAKAVDLTQYYLSDNAVYYQIAAGMAWNPPTNNPGTDFLVQFPAGTMIAPGAVLVIAANKTFEATYNKCPDLILDAMDYKCANGTAKAMVVPKNGGLDPTKQGTLLSDSREMVILFQWDGAAATVKDVDYVTWGAMFDAGATRVDKTGAMGYVADTAAAMQKSATAPTNGQSIERCAIETGETMVGGNGIAGHDETSEPMDTNFVVQAKPTPGVKNACLP